MRSDHVLCRYVNTVCTITKRKAYHLLDRGPDAVYITSLAQFLIYIDCSDGVFAINVISGGVSIGL